MKSQPIRVLLADDDQIVLNCYKSGLLARHSKPEKLDKLAAELFGTTEKTATEPEIVLTTCNQGATAVQKFKQSLRDQKPFDVVVLDIRMPPGINGVTAATEIRALDQSVTIIFASGYSDYSRNELADRLPPPEHLHYLPKPVHLKQLEATIRSVA